MEIPGVELGMEGASADDSGKVCKEQRQQDAIRCLNLFQESDNILEEVDNYFAQNYLCFWWQVSLLLFTSLEHLERGEIWWILMPKQKVHVSQKIWLEKYWVAIWKADEDLKVEQVGDQDDGVAEQESQAMVETMMIDKIKSRTW